MSSREQRTPGRPGASGAPADAPDRAGARPEPGNPATTRRAEERVVWSHCQVNCGGRCALKLGVRDGRIVRVGTDDVSPEPLQARACVRGRAMRGWVDSPERLLYPQRRVPGAPRGQGAFERIGWDEAIDEIVSRLRRTLDEYGNEAVFIAYGTGTHGATAKTTSRLMNCLGGRLDSYNDYSTAMLMSAMPYFYGAPCVGEPAMASSMSEAARSDLVVLFGNSPADTRMGGNGATWDFARVREAVRARGGRVVSVDYRLSATGVNHPGEWLPIRTGTDAALVSAIAHELIVGGRVDEGFVHEHCVGYDEQTMPAQARGRHLSYRDYIMGTGYDLVEKTPEWAAPITAVSPARIRELADALARARAPFVAQGWGPQRHSNGESASRAICMLPILLGKMGLPGTNTGLRECGPTRVDVGRVPSGPNPVRVAIPVQMWPAAIERGEELTATNAGVVGADRLRVGIKFLWNYAGNCLTNQHGDVNRMHDILADESKCETIVVWDTVMTDSARYADILLPEALPCERLSLCAPGDAEFAEGATLGGPAQEPPGECRCSYDVNAEIARRMGVGEAFTCGRTQDEWTREVYERGRALNPGMPGWDEMRSRGVWRSGLRPNVGMADFVADPEGHPLRTPSGRIEVYSQRLAELAGTLELDDPADRVWPIPAFEPGYEGYGSVTEEFPLYLSGFHDMARAHSSFGAVEALRAAFPHRLWINPLDAGPRGISDGDLVGVRSPAGEIRVRAWVTGRVVPGCLALPQGAWHDADMGPGGDRVDHGGCINTLTTYHPAPLGKGNGWANSVVCQVWRVEGAPAAATPATSDAPDDPAVPAGQAPDGSGRAVTCDARRCTGCKTCVIACQDAHGMAPGESLRTVVSREAGGWRRLPDGTLEQDVRASCVSVCAPGCDACASLGVDVASGGVPVCVGVCPLRALAMARP